MGGHAGADARQERGGGRARLGAGSKQPRWGGRGLGQRPARACRSALLRVDLVGLRRARTHGLSVVAAGPLPA
eukprot:8374458-Lingulodinium_polyedra.AAC.1